MAHRQVRGSLTFYADLFAGKCALSWPGVRDVAADYLKHLDQSCPRYVEEMRGLADGVNAASSTSDGQTKRLDLLDIVALNVRSEIAFGLFTGDPGSAQDPPLDGCTSLGVLTDVIGGEARQRTYLAQNWDWQVAQRDNIIILNIHSHEPGIPHISMVTEGGIIGKIGFNAAGVGICQNAIRARGVDVASGRLPVHLAMRKVLECSSRHAAVSMLESLGVAGSVYLLVGSSDDGASGVECTSTTVKVMQPSSLTTGNGIEMLAHTNHLLLEHGGVDEPHWLDDSKPRIERITELVDKMGSSGSSSFADELFGLFQDEECYPCSINRHEVRNSTFETLFTIVMDLTNKKALVTFGRPSAYVDKVELSL